MHQNLDRTTWTDVIFKKFQTFEFRMFQAKLPEDQRFDNIPVFALSPGQNSPQLVKSANNNKTFMPITNSSSSK